MEAKIDNSNISDGTVQTEINAIKDRTQRTDIENNIINRNIKNIESSISHQEKIYADYSEKILMRKMEYTKFMEKLDHQQSQLELRIKSAQSEIQSLRNIQEDLAFLFNSTVHKMTTNAQFLNYVRNEYGGKHLDALKDKLNIDPNGGATNAGGGKSSSMPDPKSSSQQSAESHKLNIGLFKQICKGVLTELNTNNN